MGPVLGLAGGAWGPLEGCGAIRDMSHYTMSLHYVTLVHFRGMPGKEDMANVYDMRKVKFLFRSGDVEKHPGPGFKDSTSDKTFCDLTAALKVSQTGKFQVQSKTDATHDALSTQVTIGKASSLGIHKISEPVKYKFGSVGHLTAATSEYKSNLAGHLKTSGESKHDPEELLGAAGRKEPGCAQAAGQVKPVRPRNSIQEARMPSQVSLSDGIYAAFNAGRERCRVKKGGRGRPKRPVMSDIETIPASFVCDCGLSFPRKNSLNRHQSDSCLLNGSRFNSPILSHKRKITPSPKKTPRSG